MSEVKKTRQKRKKSPVHDVVIRAFRFSIDTSESDSKKLFNNCNLLCEVQNILSIEREQNRQVIKQQKQDEIPVENRDSYLTRKIQYKRVSELMREDRRFASIHSQVLQNVAERVDVATKAWIKHHKEHRPGKKSPPGPAETKDYKSFCFPQYGSAAFIK
jgi:hypothetical protein